MAALAQLGERQTEDLKVPGSIPGLGKFNRTISTVRASVNARPEGTWYLVGGLLVADPIQQKGEAQRRRRRRRRT